MWRLKGVRFQSVAKSWKGDGSRAAKIEASVTSCSLRLLSLPQISALSTCRVVHRGLPQGSRGPHQRSGETNPGVQPSGDACTLSRLHWGSSSPLPTTVT